MSKVFLATETALGRAVVIKIVAPELAEGLSADRFTREVKLAARLQQANIVPLLNAGMAGGVPYYTMPFVEGASLRTRLDTGGPMAPGEATPRAARRREGVGLCALAWGRASRHQAGERAAVRWNGDGDRLRHCQSAHRLAHAGRQRGLDEHEHADVGRELDRHAGVHGAGASGRLEGGSPRGSLRVGRDGVRDAHRGASIRGPDVRRRSSSRRTSPRRRCRSRTKNPALPAAIADVVMRSLAKDPEQRPASAADLLAALDAACCAVHVGADRAPAASTSVARAQARAVAAALVAIVLVGTVGVWLSRRGRTADAAGEMTLAVLPIENLGGDSTTQYLADGITGEIANALKKMPGLQVSGDLSTFRFKGSHTSPAEIARQLGVRMLLTGKLQPGAGRVRLQMQLSRPDGKLLWSNTYNRESKDNFAMQDEITSAIAGEMRVVLSPTAVATSRGRPHDESASARPLSAWRVREEQADARRVAEGARLLPGRAQARSELRTSARRRRVRL